ncbi:HAMP domain-containing protein [Methylocystis sp. H62]|uniref:histidine kinase n=1 Tax=Methylocystis rosea TaxID=173366 RepID=A0A3G8MAM5_9HYPH|nr:MULTISPECIES: HAMP domain-containing protein [Methylocystis]AZG79049.1 response regulator [Methylocystis rosea]MBG0792750.1 HAMP domain-containing protein [Methylocystis sp. H62]MBG0797297.1 HAMP domain-containing protein [Methylocystis sp. L43]MBG0804678.1 HAMP domain-containing protein [Methylocystis sp. H15]QGM95925.1 response regulator [Methylocystis rosea]
MATKPAAVRTRGVLGRERDSQNRVSDDQLQELLQALQALKEGDFATRLPGHWDGVIGKIADSLNEVSATNCRMAVELERVRQAVGREGKTRQRVKFANHAGAWGGMESSVNALIDDLLWPTNEMTRVIGAVAQGDLLQSVQLELEGRPLMGEFLRSAKIVNTMIRQLREFTSEVTRVAREVGTEGKLGGQAQVREVTGVWKELTESVNFMADNLTSQVRNIAEVTIAVANGDLSKKITVDVRGEILQLKEAINTMVDQLRSFASEVTRVAREVGSDGKLGGQAIVPGVAGTWKDLTDSVNAMCGNLTDQVRNIAQVTTAVARGDLSRKITVDVKGEILELKQTINTMVDQLNSFASEVTRVAREVGTEGKLGGQAVVAGVGGTWKDLTDSVNFMAGNLTAQVRNIAEVSTAIANGNLSKKITVNVSGEILELKETINTMVDQLNAFASEVTRVAREVGTEGRLGGQAQVMGVAGTWKDLTDSVNSMAGNLTAQVRNIAEVTTAVARGDLSRKITVDVKGEILQLKETINTMVDQLNAFASEVTRVAREVGTEGKLGGQAQVPGVAGTWKDLTDNVNFMAGNLTAQVRNIAEVATAIADGDLSKKITVDVRGEILLLKETLNTMVDQLNAFAGEVTRVAREVGTDGRLGGQAVVPGVGGTWKDLTENVNLLAANLTTQVRNIAEVTTAVARGDLSRKITVDVKGEILQLKETINTMVDQLNAFASEVTRVAREVGTEGKLGGQAQVPGVAGTWKDLTDTVNVMAANLTEQVRGIVKVVTAVAEGDLSQSLTVKSKGEVAALADTINSMTRTLATFAVQVTTVAREVGVEGRLGGQANVPGAAGTWKDLTGNVNLLAANLTTQVRSIADVATAVTKGDLTRLIQVDARGEVAELKDNINTMIDNLRLTTDRNTEQDWLKTNLAKFTAMLQGQRDLSLVGRLLLSELAPLVGAQQGVIYQMHCGDGPPILSLLSAYADDRERSHQLRLSIGEGLVGQCATDKRRILINDLPADVAPIRSALFSSAPRNIVVLPVLFEGQVKAVIELATVGNFSELQTMFLEQLTASIGIVLNSIEATMQTEALLGQSQQLAAELQAQQSELQKTNEQLELKAQQVAERNVEVERKNEELEQARRALEEKAAELALTSRYKSEFLANMSHELRTPLNSILILGQQLGENPQGNLTERQVEFARTIHGAGTDLLNLISDILDLSKIESGTVTVEAEELDFKSLIERVARPFRHEAENRGLSFQVNVNANVGRSIVTDSKRLQQILKNLLSNAFKFTPAGAVWFDVRAATKGWSAQHPSLSQAHLVVAFSVRDTGIGIPQEKQPIIFEAFQQADASTSRRFGGTGLGLAISRELATLLGGEIHLRSTPGEGSTFTLCLPIAYAGAGASRSVDPQPLMQMPQAPFGSSFSIAPQKDDRENITEDDGVLLIIEDDPDYRRILADLARDKGLKVIMAATGSEAVALARSFKPTAISLDVYLPDLSGWTVLSRLKQDPSLRHIPVQMLTIDHDRKQGLARGAYSFISKSVTASELSSAIERIVDFSKPRQRRLLLIEDSVVEQSAIRALLEYDDVEIVVAQSGQEALHALSSQNWDCVVLDLGLPDMSGFDVLQQLNAENASATVPCVIFTGKKLSAEEDARLHTMAQSIVVKDVESPERLLDETALFLHRVIGDLPPEKQIMLERLHSSDEDMSGRTILLVDDDARNLFALSSLLERRGINVLTAANGGDALDLLEKQSSISLVLMDIMMPGMDGYQTIKAVRENPRFERLPIIALTAKAMNEDRERCLEAGASDYLAKPVNTEQLLSTLRLWFANDGS